MAKVCGGKLKIVFKKDNSSSGYLPLDPNGAPPVVLPIQGAGDMFKAVYDQNNNGRADRVDHVLIQEVDGLQTILNDLANQGAGDGGKEVITVTNNGGDTFIPGMPVAQNGTVYVIGKSVPPRQRVLGLAMEPSEPGQQLKIQLSGYFRLPTSQWDLVTAQPGGLAGGLLYYVNINSKLSFVVPTEAPEYAIKLGHAISQTDFLIDLDVAIKL